MKTNRRNFLRTAAVAGAAAVTAGSAVSCSRREKSSEMMPEVRLAVMTADSQTFNMSGYRAPALGKVRIGFIGLEMRGPGAVERMAHIEGVEIVQPCATSTPTGWIRCSQCSPSSGCPAKAFSGTEEAWKGLVRCPLTLTWFIFARPGLGILLMPSMPWKKGSMRLLKCRLRRQYMNAGFWLILQNGRAGIVCCWRIAATISLSC